MASQIPLAVDKYIESVDEYSGKSNLLVNHVDKDVVL